MSLLESYYICLVIKGSLGGDALICKYPVPHQMFTYPVLPYMGDFTTLPFLLYVVVGLLSKSFVLDPPNLYLCIQFLYHAGLTNSYFTQWVVTHCHIYFDIQLLPVWPVGAHQAGSSSLGPLTIPRSFWLNNMLQVYVAPSLTQPRREPFFQVVLYIFKGNMLTWWFPRL